MIQPHFLCIWPAETSYLCIYSWISAHNANEFFFLDLASKNLGMSNGPWNSAQHLASKHPQQGGSQRHKCAPQ